MVKLYASMALLLVLVIGCNKQSKEPQNQSTRLNANLPSPSSISARQCASYEVLEQQIALNPLRGKFLDALEGEIQRIQQQQIRTERAAGRLYLKVVVHVVHTNPTIVTDAQIQSQLDILNKDFQKANSELGQEGVYLAGYTITNVANCDIQFDLALVKRVTTGVAKFGTNDAVKRTSQGGSDPVNASSMLNIWVCDLDGGLLGYAQFPGGSLATDGVVVDLQAFGSTTGPGLTLFNDFNMGRTATHEVGHWINLRHIWGDRSCGDDFVGDTPLHDGANYDCGTTTQTSRCKGRPREMWMNFMDYTDDRCMYMFTKNQKERMDITIDNARKNYFSTTP